MNRKLCIFMIALLAASLCLVPASLANTAPRVSFQMSQYETTLLVGPAYTGYGAPYAAGGSTLVAYLSSPEELIKAYGREPDWQVVKTSEDDLSWRFETDPAYVQIYVDEIPDSALDCAFEITCSFGSASATASAVFRFVEGDFPTGWTLNREYSLQVGNTYELDIDFLPAEPAGIGPRELSDFGFFAENADKFAFEWIGDRGARVTPLAAGVYFVPFAIRSGNVVMEDVIKLRVADEYGYVPRLKDDQTDSTYQVWVLPYEGEENAPDSWYMNGDFPRSREMFEKYGSADWTMTQVSGPDLPIELTQSGSAFALTLPRSAVTGPARAQVQVRADWQTEDANASLTWTVDLYIMENDLASPVTLPEEIRMQVGSPGPEIQGRFADDPDSEAEPYFFLAYASGDRVWLEQTGPGAYLLLPRQPGRGDLYVRLLQGDRYTERRIPVLVADENGDVPDGD